jgi:hypothetical protein
MKKYTPKSVKVLLFLILINILMLPICFSLIFFDFLDPVLIIGLLVLFVFLALFFLCCLLAVKSRWLLIDDNKIILPRGTEHNNELFYKRTVVKICDIDSIECHLYDGDTLAFLYNANSQFYTLKLKDGTRITFHLSDYDENAEKEIIETIKNCI